MGWAGKLLLEKAPDIVVDPPCHRPYIKAEVFLVPSSSDGFRIIRCSSPLLLGKPIFSNLIRYIAGLLLWYLTSRYLDAVGAARRLTSLPWLEGYSACYCNI